MVAVEAAVGGGTCCCSVLCLTLRVAGEVQAAAGAEGDSVAVDSAAAAADLVVDSEVVEASAAAALVGVGRPQHQLEQIRADKTDMNNGNIAICS